MTVPDVNATPETLAGWQALVTDSVYRRGQFGYAVPTTVNAAVRDTLAALKQFDGDVLAEISAACNELPHAERQTLARWQDRIAQGGTGPAGEVTRTAVTGVLVGLNIYRSLRGDAATVALIKTLSV